MVDAVRLTALSSEPGGMGWFDADARWRSEARNRGVGVGRNIFGYISTVSKKTSREGVSKILPIQGECVAACTIACYGVFLQKERLDGSE